MFDANYNVLYNEIHIVLNRRNDHFIETNLNF